MITESTAAKQPGDTDQAILELAASRVSFTLADAADAAGVSKRSASAHVSALIESGKLVGEGSTRRRRFRKA